MSGHVPHVIALIGDIDISKYPQMRAAFASALDASGPVLVDLGGANHVDSYFLSELMMFARKCAARARLRSQASVTAFWCSPTAPTRSPL